MTFINADSKLKSLGLLACGVLHAIEPLNSFLASLCKFTIVLPTDVERRSSLAQSPVSKRSEVQVDQKDVIVLTPKNVQALRTLFNIAHRLHNVLGPSWVLVLETLAALDRAIHSPHATTHVNLEVATAVPKLTREPSRQYADFSIISSLNSQGEALVMGYDDMGYELWKPNLRAIMEHDMNEVSVGRKTKAEVLETCLQQMKACFLDARVKKSKLLEAMTIFFERSNNTDEGENQTAGEIVRQCNLYNKSDMALRKNRDGNFMVGCMNYPQCRNAVWPPGPTLQEALSLLMFRAGSEILEAQAKFKGFKSNF